MPMPTETESTNEESTWLDARLFSGEVLEVSGNGETELAETRAEADEPSFFSSPWDRDVLKLDEAEPDSDALIQELAARAARGEAQVVETLWAAAYGSYLSFSPDARSLSLEILAMAGATQTEKLAYRVARDFLSLGSETLRFAAIAAASDLSLQSRTLLRSLIEKHATVSEPDANVRAAANAFLAADARHSER